MSDLSRLRLIYFFSYAVYGVVVPYLPLVFHELGFNDSAISLCLLGLGIAALLSPALIAHVTDRHLPWNKVMATLLMGGCGSSLLWLYVNSVFGAFGVTLIFFLFLVPIIGLLDAHTLQFLAKQEKPPAFHTMRVLGSIGFIVPTLVLGVVALRFPIHAPFLILFCSGTCVLAALIAWCLPPITPEVKPLILPIKEALSAAWARPLRNYMIGVCLGSIALSMLYVILPRILQENGESTVSVGFITIFGVVVETLLLFNAGTLVKRFGVEQLTHFAIFAVCLRMLIIASADSTWLIILSQLLHGPIILGFFVAGILLIAKSAKQSFHFSLQSIYTIIMMGISRIVGVLVLAFLMIDHGDSVQMRLHFASWIAALFAFSGFAWVWLTNNRRTSIMPKL